MINNSVSQVCNGLGFSNSIFWNVELCQKHKGDLVYILAKHKGDLEWLRK